MVLGTAQFVKGTEEGLLMVSPAQFKSSVEQAGVPALQAESLVRKRRGLCLRLPPSSSASALGSHEGQGNRKQPYA